MIRGRERMIQPHLCTPDSVGLDTSSGVDKFLPAKAEFALPSITHRAQAVKHSIGKNK